jgi:hypothetical protein
VVRLTSAVSVTRKTLNGSMKNCSSAAVSVPAPMTRAVSAQAARKVARLMATFASGAHRRAPKKPSNTAPATGVPRSSRKSTYFSSFNDSR